MHCIGRKALWDRKTFQKCRDNGWLANPSIVAMKFILASGWGSKDILKFVIVFMS